MDTESISLWLLGLTVVAALGITLAVLCARPSMVLRRPGVKLVKCEELPGTLEKLFAPADRMLRGLGFAPAFCTLETELAVRSEGDCWKRVYKHPRERAYAAVAAAEAAAAPGCEITFATVYADGTLLLTVNGRRHRILGGEVPRAVLTDPYAYSVKGQYQAHRAEALDSDQISERVAPSPAVYKSRLQLAYDTYIDVLVEDRWIRPYGEDDYAVRRKHAKRFKRGLKQGERRCEKARVNADLSPGPDRKGARGIGPIRRVA